MLSPKIRQARRGKSNFLPLARRTASFPVANSETPGELPCRVAGGEGALGVRHLDSESVCLQFQ